MTPGNSNRNNCRAVLRRVTAIVAVACLIVSFAGVLSAQSTRIDGGRVLQDGFGFYWETRLEPPTPPFADGISTATTEEPGIIHRLLLDGKRRVYVGYDVRVESLQESNSYRVTFGRLRMKPEATKYLSVRPPDWSQIKTPGWDLPAPRVIKGGDVLELTLLVNPATSQRVVDYVTVQERSRRFPGFELAGERGGVQRIPEREFFYAPGPARDFSVGDVHLTLAAPRLSVNGKLDESSTRRFDEVSGSVVWIASGNRGRYILSLLPHPEFGFRKAGEVRGSSLTFAIGNDTFTLNTGGRIAPGEAPFNLYVLHDPGWRPDYPNADLSAFFMGASDQTETLVPKKQQP